MLGERTLVPLHDEGLASFHGRPGIVGDHGHAVGDLNDLLDARNGLGFVASKLATLPPNTGQRSSEAYSIPGTLTSIPKVVLPLTFAGVSRRFWACRSA